MDNRFIAALDQSGGSAEKALKIYGIENYDNSKLEDLIFDFRKRVITSKVFTGEKIFGTILFKDEIFKKIQDKYTVDYLKDKGILSFVKIDEGILPLCDGVMLMKEIPNLEETLKTLKEKGVYGTKMRSVIKMSNKHGISKIVKQQFSFARIIYSFGLIPILEPEVSIDSLEKELCEKILKDELIKALHENDDIKVMFKLTLPSINNFYSDLLSFDNVIGLWALSGGYNHKLACNILNKNKCMKASFSRALLQDLRAYQSKEEFDSILKNSIDDIFMAGKV